MALLFDEIKNFRNSFDFEAIIKGIINFNILFWIGDRPLYTTIPVMLDLDVLVFTGERLP